MPRVSAGDTFLVAHPYNHLYVVCSDPVVDSLRIVLVSITTFKPKEEACCMLAKGEHPFVKHRSCVRYKDARIATEGALMKLLSLSQMTVREPVSEDLLARIRTGARESDFLPEDCRRVLQNQSLI
jgi:hypothetical protein